MQDRTSKKVLLTMVTLLTASCIALSLVLIPGVILLLTQ
jgi:hypothetical protein